MSALRVSKKWLNATFLSFSFGACAYGAASTSCRESLATQAPFADLPHTPQGAFSCPCGAIYLVSPNPNKAIRGCGPLSTPGFFDRLRAAYARSYLYFVKNESTKIQSVNI